MPAVDTRIAGGASWANALGLMADRGNIGISGFARKFNPSSMFTPTTPGWVYDLSDFSTLFQDSAGTTPVTAAGQPVGLVLDKSGNGNHASQPTAGKRPILQQAPFGGVRNLLTYTEDFSTLVVWYRTSCTVTGNYLVADSGATLASGAGIYQTGSLPSSIMTQTWEVKAGAFTSVSFRENLLTGAVTNVDLLTGDVSGYADATTVTSLADGWWRISIKSSAPVDNKALIRMVPTATGDGVSGIYIRKPQLEAGSVATDYQKVTNQYTVTEEGKASCWSLKFDGIDDFMSTAAIDFTVTDKLALWAGVASGSQTLYSNIINLGDGLHGSVAGGFWFPLTNTQGTAITVQGTTSLSYAGFASATTWPAGQRNVATFQLSSTGAGYSDLVPYKAIEPLNVVWDATGSGIPGSGTFGNLPLFLGRAWSTTFGGNLYSSVGLGREATADELTKTQAWVAEKTGVTL